MRGISQRNEKVQKHVSTVVERNSHHTSLCPRKFQLKSTQLVSEIEDSQTKNLQVHSKLTEQIEIFFQRKNKDRNICFLCILF